MIFFNFHDLNYCVSSAIRHRVFSAQNNPKNLVPSYKTDLDLWDCLGRVKSANFHGAGLVFVVILEREKTQFYSQINTAPY